MSTVTCEKCIWNNKTHKLCEWAKEYTPTWNPEEECWAVACSQWRRWEGYVTKWV